MVKAVFMRAIGNVLVPVDDAAINLVKSLKTGQGVELDAKRKNNAGFHAKLMALMRLAFDVWEPPVKELNGQQITKNFEAFRKDLVVMAGYYDAHYSPDGSVRLEPHSLAFGACEHEKREEVYKAILTVVWERILRHANYRSEAEVETIVNKLLGFE